MWSTYRVACLAALVGFVSGALLFGFGAWKWQAGNILELKLEQSNAELTRSNATVKGFKDNQLVTDAAVFGVQKKIEGLQAERDAAKKKLRDQRKESPACQAWSDQHIACSF